MLSQYSKIAAIDIGLVMKVWDCKDNRYFDTLVLKRGRCSVKLKRSSSKKRLVLDFFRIHYIKVANRLYKRVAYFFVKFWNKMRFVKLFC